MRQNAVPIFANGDFSMTAISHASTSTSHVHQAKPQGGKTAGKAPQAKTAPEPPETKAQNSNSGKSVNRTV